MKKITLIVSLLTSVTTLIASSVSDAPKALINGHEAGTERVIARFRADIVPAQRSGVYDANDVTESREFNSVPGLVVLKFNPRPSANAVVPIPHDPVEAGRLLQNRIKRLMKSGHFSYVEPDYVMRALVEPSDTAYQDGTLWGLDNINAPQAWDTTTGSSSVVVAVIDSGVNYLHQDLASQMWLNPGETPNNGLDDDDDGYIDNVYGFNAITDDGDPMDDNAHGSHVAGTIGASANDGGRHVGVAWTVKIMALKFLDSAGSGLLIDAIECIDFARDNNAHIMNNSWGGGPYVQALNDAIHATSDAGMLFVAAAGNESNNNDFFPAYPASYNVENVISVAAIDRNNQLASFSNYGNQSVHIGAPGVSIFSSTHTSSSAYDTFNGTSMAAPHVAGAAALLWADSNPTTREDMLVVRQQLLASAQPTPSLDGLTTTGGRLDVGFAINNFPDGDLELSVKSDAGTTVFAGRAANIFVTVSDLLPVNNGTVSATADFGGGTLAFQNNGVFPDATANDNIYTATTVIPTGITQATFTVTASAPGKNQSVDTVLFAVLASPDNDLFFGRKEITTVPTTITDSTLDATAEPGEPFHYLISDYGQVQKSLWWTWTAPHTRPYTLSTSGSDFDTVLAIYQGNSIDSLFEVAANNDSGFDWTSGITFFAIKNTEYHFVVDGFPKETSFFEPLITAAGGVQLGFWQNNPMENNDFEDRTPIYDINSTISNHNMGSTDEPGEREHDPKGGTTFSSVWWTWTPNVSQQIWFSTAGSSIDSVIAVYSGSNLGSLQMLGSDNDVAFPSTLTSEVSFFANAGEEYQIVVDGLNPDENNDRFGIPRGQIDLHVANTPANDDFANAILLEGEHVETEAYSMGASFESGEPWPDPSNDKIGGRTVWWKWTAPRSGKATVTTDGSNFDTTLGVYTGNAVNSLTTIAGNDDRVLVAIRTSLLTFAAEEGVTYYIQVDGWEADDDGITRALAGRVQLSLMMDGRSVLARPILRDNGTATFDLLGEPNRIYVLESSPNLADWAGVATNTVVSRKVRFEEPTPSVQGPRFYRARPASLISEE